MKFIFILPYAYNFQTVWFQPGYGRQFGHPRGVRLMDKKTKKNDILEEALEGQMIGY